MLRQWFDIGKSSRLMRGFGLAALMTSMFLAGAVPAEAETWTGRKDGCGEPGASPCGDNGTWGDKYNWDSETVPGAQDDVIIPFGSIRAAPPTVKNLTLNGGTLHHDVELLTVTETLTISGGEIRAFNGLNVGRLVMSGGRLSLVSCLLKGNREEDRKFIWTGGTVVTSDTEGGGLTVPADGELQASGSAAKLTWACSF